MEDLQTQQRNVVLVEILITLGGNLTTAGTLTTQNNNVTINAVGAARTLTLNESLTVGDGHDGTITFGAASKTLTIENTSLLNQDLTTDASPTFAGATITGTLTVQEIHTEFESASILFTSGSTQFGNSTDDVHNVTGSMKITGSFQVDNGTLTAGTVDINGGTIDGITSLTAGGDLDIGAHDLRAATLTADGLTAGRVPFAGTAGLLSDDSDLTFATATLSATNLTTTGTIKNMALVSGSSVSTGSFGRVQTITAVSSPVGKFTTEVSSSSGKFTAITGVSTLTADGNLDIGAHDFRAATLTADGLTSGRVTFAGTNGVLSDDSDLTFATATLSATNLTTTGTIKNMALVSGSSVSTGSFGNVNVSLDLDVDGTTNLDVVDIDGAVDMASTLALGGTLTVNSSTVNDDFAIFKNTNTTAGASVPIFLSSMSGGSQTNVSIENAGVGSLVFRTGNTAVSGFGTQRMFISSSGKIGIGTASPSTPLEVHAESGGSTFSIAKFDLNTIDFPRAGTFRIGYGNSADYDLSIKQAASSGLVKYSFDVRNNGTDYANNLVLDRGKVGIGETSPDEELHISANQSAPTCLKIEAKATGERADINLYGIKTDNGGFAEILFLNNGGDSTGAIACEREGANDAGAIVFTTQATGAGMVARGKFASGGDFFY